jgi:serine/threonine protein kinase
MPILDGCTLDEWFRQSQKVTFGFLYMLGIHLAKGLKATHDKGLVHRDIKPSNIWISGNGMSAKIMDFGLVLDTNETQRFTRVGVLMGTVHFMSPEQMNDGPVDARADLYCLGLILYLCCTGRLPYGQLSFLQMIKALFFVKIVPPHEQNSTVPLKVSECIMRLLDVKPETRLGNSSDFIQAWEDAFAALGRDSTANQECVYRGHFLDETATPTGAWELK